MYSNTVFVKIGTYAPSCGIMDEYMFLSGGHPVYKHCTVHTKSIDGDNSKPFAEALFGEGSGLLSADDRDERVHS